MIATAKEYYDEKKYAESKKKSKFEVTKGKIFANVK